MYLFIYDVPYEGSYVESYLSLNSCRDRYDRMKKYSSYYMNTLQCYKVEEEINLKELFNDKQ